MDFLKIIVSKEARLLTTGAVLALLMVPVRMVVSGFVLTRLWAWFVVPILSVRELSIAAAIGISLTVQLVLLSGSSSNGKWEFEEEANTFGTQIVKPIFLALGPLIFLAVGWIVQLFL